MQISRKPTQTLRLALALSALLHIAVAQSTTYVPDAFPIGSTVSSYFFNASGFCGACINGTYAFRIPAALMDPLNPNIRDISFAAPASGTWIGTDIQVRLGHLPTTLPSTGLELPGRSDLGSLLNDVVAYDSAVSGPLNWQFTPMAWSPMGLGGTQFDWDGVHDVLVSITFGNATNINWMQQGPLGFYDSLTNTPECWYSGAYQFRRPFRQSIGGLKACLEVGPAANVWQGSSPAASLSLDGMAGSSAFPIKRTVCVGDSVSLGLSGTPGPGWDLAIGIAAPVALGAGGFATPGGQRVNLDLSDPFLFYLWGLGFTTPFQAQTWPVILPAPARATAQMIKLDPSNPDGFALSGAVSIQAQPAPTLQGPTSIEGRTMVNLQDPLWCGPTSVDFAGTTYSALYVYANGYITFTPQWSDPSPTALEFSYSPCLAGWWSDLDPGQGGNIEISHANGVISVTWTMVPESNFPTHAASLVMEFDTNVGFCTIRHTNIPSNWFRSSLVGLSPGLNAIDPGPTPFDLAIGNGTVTGPGAGAMAYELFLGSSPPSFSEITFLFSDASFYTVF